jgi:alpha-glucosidase (family GH31 glycosyl hydrolase)
MRAVWLIVLTVSVAQAAVVSRDWANGKLTLKLDDGTAEVEWISSVAVRFSRTWGPALAPVLPKIKHERVTPGFVDVSGGLTMRTKYLTFALNGADLSWQVSSGEAPVASGALVKTAAGAALRLGMAENERVFGLMGGTNARLNLRGEKLERRNGFFFTSAGYGIFMRSPERCVFDMTSGAVEAPGATSIEFMFYWGPTAKEILEQHQTVAGVTEVPSEALDVMPAERLPKEATPLPKTPLDSWDALGATIRRLNEWSLSGVLYPAFDLASFDNAPNDVKQRAADLSTMLPIVYRSSGEGNVDRTMRDIWKPYLITYLREAHDRGFPLIRPLPMQFSKDANSDRQADVFMLGDEVLMAPVDGPGNRRRLTLPRGLWTDLRTNAEYHGNQSIEVDAPVGRVPMFVRNGWIIPLATRLTMELHYYPSLGGEFFLWEPDVNENSQFHASPAGEFLRVEIETQVRRTYEWVIHHTKAAHEVADESAVYKKVEERALLKPGTWWHDAAENNLHLMLRADPGSDRIVNVSF